jgi:hypothetical protein
MCTRMCLCNGHLCHISVHLRNFLFQNTEHLASIVIEETNYMMLKYSEVELLPTRWP